MLVLLTGATGFIGSHIADDLLSKGINVRCIIRKSSDLTWLKGKKVELVEADFNDVSSLEATLDGVDSIIHCAGVIAAKNYEGFIKGNKTATLNLIQAVLNKKIDLKRFLYVSSLMAFGPSKDLQHPVLPYQSMNPLSAYGRSKQETESALEEYKKIIPITIVRPPAVYGPRDKATFSIFKSVYYGIGTLIGFNEKYVSLVSSMDLSRGINEACLSENTIGKSYFISSDEFYTWPQIMAEMKKAFNKKHLLTLKLPHSLVIGLGGFSEFVGKFSKNPPVFDYEKGVVFTQDYWTCSIENAKEDFGYEQKFSLSDGIKITADWYKENKWL